MKSALCFLTAAKRCEIASLRQLALTSTLVHAVGDLVHSLQRERGLCNLYLGAMGTLWAEEYRNQVACSGGLQVSLLAAFEQLDTETARAGQGARLFARIAYVLQGLSALTSLRQRVLTQQWSTRRATAAYGRLIEGLLAVVFEAADGAADPAISRHLVALFNFLQGKELAGQERAAGSALFAAGRADADGQQRLLNLIESQERCLQIFADFVNSELRSAWQQAQRPGPMAQLERQRRILATTTAGQPLDAGLSQPWFDNCTARIDAMKEVEGALTAELMALCQQRLQAAEQDLIAFERLHCSIDTQGANDGAEFFENSSIIQSLPVGLTHPGQGFGPQVERSILDLVQQQAQRLQTIGDELDTVRASLTERKTIERAKGLLMAHRQLSEDEAHKTMREMAMNQNMRLLDVAEAVLAMAKVLSNRSA